MLGRVAISFSTHQHRTMGTIKKNTHGGELKINKNERHTSLFLTKQVTGVYAENHKMLMNELESGLSQWRDTLVLDREDLAH